MLCDPSPEKKWLFGSDDDNEDEIIQNDVHIRCHCDVQSKYPAEQDREREASVIW